METQDIRWKQRFANFEKAYFQLEKATNQAINASDLEKKVLFNDLNLPMNWHGNS